MIIAHISDTHICLPQREERDRLGDLAKAVVEINLREPAVDVVIHTGDIVQWGREDEYLAARTLLQKLKTPYYVIPGNRDKRATMVEVFSNAIGNCGDERFIQYSIDHWPVRMIMLDSLNEGNRLGKFCNCRLDEFIAMLATDPKKPTIVFIHHPPFDVLEAPEPFQFDSRKTVEKIATILAENRQITNLYCGHSHRAVDSVVGGVSATIVPSIAIDLRWGTYPKSHRNRPIFNIYEF